jgi:uncharacterized membrane protein
MKNNDVDKLLTDESEYIQKLHDIVEESIKKEKLIISDLLNPAKEMLTRGQEISDKVARFGGSWRFIIMFMTLLVAWIIYNVLAPQGENFDPYPFILMNLLLSCIAALQAPIIMMSQNRKEEKDRLRSENDYMINLKAEMQIRSLHQKMDLLLEDQVKTLFDSQAKQFEMLKEIKTRLDKLSSKQ